MRRVSGLVARLAIALAMGRLSGVVVAGVATLTLSALSMGWNFWVTFLGIWVTSALDGLLKDGQSSGVNDGSTIERFL